MKLLQDLIKNVNEFSEPALWTDKLSSISEESKSIRKELDIGKYNIYGTNTLTGHRENEIVSEDQRLNYTRDLIRSHKIGGGPYYSKRVARFITFTKIYSWSAGLTGVSPELFKLVSKAAIDSKFSPKIPVGCSYSSGDVIPAAHWADEVINRLENLDDYKISSNDIMPLINGNFIQVGYAASLAYKIKNYWIYFVEISLLFQNISKANDSNLFYTPKQNNPSEWISQTMNYIKGGSTNKNKNKQDPVSFRALPQLLETFCDAINGYFTEINSLLDRPSGNPLFNKFNNYEPISQASFLAPTLAIRTSSLIESVLFLMWAMVNRTNYLLSGQIEHIPRDAASSKSRLGLIQVPKLMMSILENSRALYGQRAFSSGSQTSYGIEDLWTNGVIMVDHLSMLLKDFGKLCSYELYVINYIAKNNNYNTFNDKSIMREISGCESAEEILNIMNEENFHNFKFLSDIFILKI
ncbi:aromatic amino acid lyase [Pseudoalteromonas distincta]|uniref:aromatic amino acid lyase n=1 Tax=Pseudoalteromonas distincta TaxID=77608 RepID=UPI0011F285EB|nr:aromatic amino acid lyase [Pseudoalteromonas distincta]KAA1161558.1 hypothetical protein EU511_08460 [Pseudoalteromonas distincta]